MGRRSCKLLDVITCFFQLTLFAFRALANIPVNYGVVGGKASLPCNITVTAGDETIALILWYKGESLVPIYTLDARNHPVQQARHFPSTELGSRAYFDVTLKTPSLTIYPVNFQDEGEYKCRIDYRRSRTVSHSVRLKVIVPPRETIIKNEEGNKLEGIIGPYDEGSSLNLICESTGGDPSPSVTWWQDSSLLDDSFSSMENGIVRNELHLPKLERSDLMTGLACQASNTNLTVPTIGTVTLDMNVKPLDVYFTGVHPLAAGKKGSLVCETTGSRPPATLSFWKDGKQVQTLEEDILQDDVRTRSKVTFVPSAEDNGKYLMCRADHPTLPNSTLENELKLDVHHSPILRLALGANIQHSSIKEGTDVYFDCNVKANPWITDIGWIFQGMPLLTNLSSGVMVNNHSLVLQKVTKEHRGRYQCIATNVQGEGQSEVVKLEVQYAPVCKQQYVAIIEITKDEPTNVTCEVEADPTDSTFHWTLNNTAVDIDVQTLFANGTMTMITYIPRTSLDFGELLCWGRNSVGVQKYPCVFRINEIANTEQTSVSPILGVLIGIVGVLVLLAGVVIFIMRMNGGDSDKVQPHIEIETKIEDSLKKEIEELQDTTGKGPDIIPPNNDTQITTYESRRESHRSRPAGPSYSTFSSSEEISENITSILPQRVTKPNSEVLYAELSFPTAPRQHLLRQAGPSIEYAEIDFVRSRMPQRRPPSPDTDEDDFGITTEWPLVYNVGLQRNKKKLKPTIEYSTTSTPL